MPSFRDSKSGHALTWSLLQETLAWSVKRAAACADETRIAGLCSLGLGLFSRKLPCSTPAMLPEVSIVSVACMDPAHTLSAKVHSQGGELDECR